MIQLLRHSAVCLWLAILVGALVSFWGLPPLQSIVGFDVLPFVMIVWLAVLFVACGWASNRIGLGRVHRLMRSAELADQDGLRSAAEESYRNALAVLDSFWVAPHARRRILPRLAGRLARFYLSQPRLESIGENFIVGYLWAYPNDEEVVEQWVRGTERQGGLHEDHQDLAMHLGMLYPHKDAVQEALARLYLMLERTDYLALQCYRRVCDRNDRTSTELCQNVARLMEKNGRSDEWVRRASMLRPESVGPPPGERSDLPRFHIAELTAAGTGVPETLDEIHAVESFRMGPEEDEPEEDEEEGRSYLLAGPGGWSVFLRRLQEMALAAGRQTTGGLRRLARSGRAAAARMHGIKRVRAAMFGLLFFAGAGVALWIAVHTTGLTWRAPESPSAPEPAPLAPPVVTDPYTLQVAAYLKQEYALKFVQELKEHNLDAYYTETLSGGKRWFQVRISHFADQQSAREFGRNLKQKGLIEDFYVTHYVP